MTADDDAVEPGWSITKEGASATIHLLRDVDADDAFPLKNALAKLTDSKALTFDVAVATYIAHSAQAVIRDECKTRPVAMRGISDRLRRVLQTDKVQLLSSVIEEPAA